MQEAELQMLIEVDKICRENGLAYYLAYGTALGAVRHKGFIPWDSDLDIAVDTDSYAKFCQAINDNISGKYCVYSIETDRNYEELFARIGLKNNPYHEIHLDIFPLAGAPKTAFLKKLFARLAYINYRCFFVKRVNVNVNFKKRPGKKRQAILAKLVLSLIPAGFFVWVYKTLSKAYPLEQADTLCNICGAYGYKELFPKTFFGEPEYLEFEGHKFPVPKEWDKYLSHIYGDYLTPRKINYV